MNKTEMLKHLNNQRGYQISKSTLKKTLQCLGIDDNSDYTEADIAKLLEARRIIDEYNGSEEGYSQAATRFGATPSSPSISRPTSSRGKSRSPEDATDTFARRVEQDIIDTYADTVKAVSAKFFQSPASYQMMRSIVHEQLEEQWETRVPGWRKSVVDRIATVDVDAEGIPPSASMGLPGSTDDTDSNENSDADFHSYTDNNGEVPE